MSGHSKVVSQDLMRIHLSHLDRLANLPARDRHDDLAWNSGKRGINQSAGDNVLEGVVDGFHVTAQTVPNMSVQVGMGVAYAPSVGITNPVPSPQTLVDSAYKQLCKRAATASLAVAAAHATLNRIDLVEIAVAASSATETDVSETIGIYNPATKVFDALASQVTMKHGEPDVFITTGTPSATPSAPALTAGRIPIAIIRVYAAVTTIRQQDIFDVRRMTSEREAMDNGDPLNELRTAELHLDVPYGATNASVLRFTANVWARVKGRQGGFVTDAPLDMCVGAYWAALVDWNYFSAVTTEKWWYLYLVIEDDQGLRRHRGNVNAANESVGSGASGTFSHSGVLVFSEVAPVMTNGSLAPTSTLAISPAMGGGTCNPAGTGKAVCIGAFRRSASAQRFLYGTTMIGGKAKFGIDASSGEHPNFATTNTYTSSTSSSSIETSAIKAMFDTAGADAGPSGPLSYDLTIRLQTQGSSSTKAGAQKKFRCFETDGTNYTRLIRTYETVNGTPALAAYMHEMVLENVGINEVPANRATRQGIKILCEVYPNDASVASGLNNPSVYWFARIQGYTWPQGVVTI